MEYHEEEVLTEMREARRLRWVAEMTHVHIKSSRCLVSARIRNQKNREFIRVKNEELVVALIQVRLGNECHDTLILDGEKSETR